MQNKTQKVLPGDQKKKKKGKDRKGKKKQPRDQKQKKWQVGGRQIWQ